MKVKPIQEGSTKSNVKKYDGKGRQAPPPPFINTSIKIENILKNAMSLIDDYLNAGSKEERSVIAPKAKALYKKYYGKEYKNRLER
jgi:hypothetical protein